MGTERTPQAMATAMRSIEAAFLVDAAGATLAGATEVWLVRHGDCYDPPHEIRTPPPRFREDPGTASPARTRRSRRGAASRPGAWPSGSGGSASTRCTPARCV